MRKSLVRPSASILTLLCAIAWGGDASAREFSALRGVDYGYAQARSECDTYPILTIPCRRSEFGTPVHATCENLCEGVSAGSGVWPWQPSGHAYWAFGDALEDVASLGLNGVTRVDPDLLLLPGSYRRGLGSDLELSVFLYAGDPSAFDGRTFYSVLDLVALGLIEEQDILFLETDFPETGDPYVGEPVGWEPFSFEVHPQGAPDEEIVVMVTGVGAERDCAFSCETVPVPSLSGTGVVVLTFLMLAAFRNRQR